MSIIFLLSYNNSEPNNINKSPDMERILIKIYPLKVRNKIIVDIKVVKNVDKQIFITI